MKLDVGKSNELHFDVPELASHQELRMVAVLVSPLSAVPHIEHQPVEGYS
jgi:hypothetical protein